MTGTTESYGRITRAIIPAAGKGTRLLPLTRAVPKELMPLGGRPVLEYIVDEVIAAGITDLLFVISDAKTAIRDHFGGGTGGVRLEYAFQAEQKGLADAVYCAKEFAAGEPFAVVLGDSVIDTDQAVSPFARVLKTYEETPARGVIVVQHTPLEEVSRYGIVSPRGGVGPRFEIDGLIEKPSRQDAPSDLAVAGRYAFDPVLFEYIERTQPGAGGEYQISDSIRLMIEDGHPVWCVALSENEVRRDIGTFESYFEAFAVEVERLRQADDKFQTRL